MFNRQKKLYILRFCAEVCISDPGGYTSVWLKEPQCLSLGLYNRGFQSISWKLIFLRRVVMTRGRALHHFPIQEIQLNI
jgi:hypothetical protein